MPCVSYMTNSQSTFSCIGLDDWFLLAVALLFFSLVIYGWYRGIDPREVNQAIMKSSNRSKK